MLWKKTKPVALEQLIYFICPSSFSCIPPPPPRSFRQPDVFVCLSEQEGWMGRDKLHSLVLKGDSVCGGVVVWVAFVDAKQ